MIEDSPSSRRALQVRRPNLSFSGEEPAWFAGNFVVTSFCNVLSLAFPVVEPLFIQVIRERRDEIEDPALLADVDAFIGQEAQHAKQHVAMNRWIRTLGYPVDETSQYIRGYYTDLRARLSRDALLAYVVAFEHLTAVGSSYMLRRPELFAGDAGSLTIQWHLLEELEHKHVAFDVYQACVGDTRLRRRVMIEAILGFFVLSTRAIGQQLRGRRLSLGQLLFSGRVALTMWAANFWSLLRYLRADFHPDEVDHSGILDAYRDAEGAWVQRVGRA